MIEPTVALLDYLRKMTVELDPDFLRESIRLMSQLLMELEVSEQIGAQRYERSAERATQRNGYRKRTWETRVGEVPLQIPKLHQGTYYSGLLEPRRRAEQALLNVIQEAYVHGVSTRKVDDLVQALGLTGIDKSKVSHICQELDAEVAQFRERPLEHSYPYLWLDALVVKGRQNGRVATQAVVIAMLMSTCSFQSPFSRNTIGETDTACQYCPHLDGDELRLQ